MFDIQLSLPDLRKLFQRNDGKDIATEGRNIIRERTQAGFGVIGGTRGVGGTLAELPPLRPRTIEKRKRLRGRKGKAFSPSRSNVTYTGGLLRSLRAGRKRSDGVIRVSDTKATSRRRRLRNTQLVRLLAQRGFTFFGVTRNEEEELQDFYNEIIQNRVQQISE